MNRPTTEVTRPALEVVRPALEVVRPALEVVRPGLLGTVQDLGRPGLAHLGVPRSGAADPANLRLGNRLVGNAPDAAGLEATLTGIDVRLSHARWVAVTGAVCQVTVDGRPAATDTPVYLPAGALLRVGPALHGIRAYLAVAGGIAVPPTLGSRSTDTLGGLGPAPLATGTVLPVGEVTGPPAPVDVAPRPAIPRTARVRLIPGPRDDWFTPASLRELFRATYQVTGASNRIGARLDGPPLVAARPGGLPSEGMVLGAVQVPPGGKPIVFLADHPTTGGYPVVGVVHPGDLWLVAQAAPGTEIRFQRSGVPG